MTITCDTSLGDILSKQDVTPILNSISNEIDSYVNTITSAIQTEATSNGLSPEAYYVNDSADLNQKAIELLSSIQLENLYTSIRSEIMRAGNKQRKHELQELYDRITEKISSLEGSINSELTPSAISSIENSIRHYTEKKEKVRSLL